MKSSSRLLLASLLLSLGAWGQRGSSEAPKSRPSHEAGVHKMPRREARQLSAREKQENAQLRAQQRRDAKLAKKQRREGKRRSRRVKNAEHRSQ